MLREPVRSVVVCQGMGSYALSFGMARKRDTGGTDEPRFCPFCRDPFDGTEVCPTHGLTLVPFLKLPPEKVEDEPWPDTQPLARWSPAFGRWVVALGAATILVAFWLPWLHIGRIAMSAQTLAVRAVNLWSVPLAAVTLLVVLATRRSPSAMRSARLAAAVVSLFPLVNLVYTLLRIYRGAERQQIDVALAVGPFVLVFGVLVAFVGTLRLGRHPRPRASSTGVPVTEQGPTDEVVREAPRRTGKKRRLH